MELVVQTISNVLILSAMYMLVALGFAFLFSMLGILNLAHGAIYMVAGYIGFVLISAWGIQQWLGLLLTTLIVAAFGVFLEHGVVDSETLPDGHLADHREHYSRNQIARHTKLLAGGLQGRTRCRQP